MSSAQEAESNDTAPQESADIIADMSKRSGSQPNTQSIEITVTLPPKEIPTDSLTGSIDFEHRVIRVAVFFSNGNKEFIGGYQHKRTQRIFHHASVQHPIRVKPITPRLERETQTVTAQNSQQQTNHDNGTQMTRTDLVLDETADFQITSKPYIPSSETEATRDDSVRKIQCATRQWLARKQLQAKRERRQQLEQNGSVTEESHIQSIQENIPLDFRTIKKEISEWAQTQLAQVQQQNVSPKEKRKHKADIIKEEVQMISEIEHQQNLARTQKRKDALNASLRAMAAPKKWIMGSGEEVLIETPYTLHAKELIEIYYGLKCMKYTSEERLAVLLDLQDVIQTYPHSIVDEILDLAERELDLLRRKRPVQSLKGLRLRISSLYFRLLCMPSFNPEAVRFQKVPARVPSFAKSPRVSADYKPRLPRIRTVTSLGVQVQFAGHEE